MIGRRAILKGAAALGIGGRAAAETAMQGMRVQGGAITGGVGPAFEPNVPAFATMASRAATEPMWKDLKWWARDDLLDDARRVYEIEHDIAVMRSWSLAHKVGVQRRRQLERVPAFWDIRMMRRHHAERHGAQHSARNSMSLAGM